MNFRSWLESIGLINSLEDALRTLDLQRGATEEEIKLSTRKLLLKYHPDIIHDSRKAKLINAAYDYLQHHGFGTKVEQPIYYSREIPPWQTDLRSAYNEVGHDFRNLNYCKKIIYEKAIKVGELKRWVILAFDGMFFRGVFTVFCNEPTLDFSGMAMEQWNSYGANSYPTKAVFAHRTGEKELILIRFKGKEMTDRNIKFIHESFNLNPNNDQDFVKNLRRALEEL